MLPLDVARCTGVLTTDPAAELCKRCERAEPGAVTGVMLTWVEPMARKHNVTGVLVCECFRPAQEG